MRQTAAVLESFCLYSFDSIRNCIIANFDIRVENKCGFICIEQYAILCEISFIAICNLKLRQLGAAGKGVRFNFTVHPHWNCDTCQVGAVEESIFIHSAHTSWNRIG